MLFSALRFDITATAIRGLGGVFEGQLKPHNNVTRIRAEKMLGEDYGKIWRRDELCSSDDSIFVATGVCDGWLKGVEIKNDIYYTTTCIINVKDKEYSCTRNKKLMGVSSTL